VNIEQTDLRAEPSSASGVVQYAVTLSKLNWLIRFKPVSHKQRSTVKTVSHRQHITFKPTSHTQHSTIKTVSHRQHTDNTALSRPCHTDSTAEWRNKTGAQCA